MAQKILFELVAEDTSLGLRIEQARKNIRDLNKEIRANPGPERMSALVAELGKTRRELTEATKQQRALNKEFEALKVPKDSLAGLRLEYGRLTQQIAKLSAQERNSDFGKNLVRQAARTKREIDGIEESLGRFTGSVGNYRKAFTSVFDIAGGVLLAGGIANGVQLVTDIINDGVEAVRNYGVALSRLSSITGVTGESLDELRGKAEELTTIKIGDFEIANTAEEIFNAFTLVGSARPELLKDADALKQVTEQAIILSKASGDDLATSVEAVTTTLGQFQLEASDTNRIINELAAGSKEGASEIADTTVALQKFGTTAAITNVSTSESIALIETLADRQLKGAEAGTQLRNILAKLAGAEVIPRKGLEQLQRAGVDINILKDNTIPLIDRLRELSKIQGDTAALTKVFGLENLSAAQIITQGVPKFEKLLTAIQGTNEAYDQAAINADNLDTRLENLRTKGLNALTNAFLAIEPALNTGIDLAEALGDALGFVIENTTDFIALGAAITAAYKTDSIIRGLKLLTDTQRAGIAVTNLLVGAEIRKKAVEEGLTLAQQRRLAVERALLAVQKAAPAVLVVTAIYAIVKAYQAWNDELSSAEKAQRSLNRINEEAVKNTASERVRATELIGVIKDETAAREDKERAIRALQEISPEYFAGLDIEKTKVGEIDEALDKYIDSLLRAAKAKSAFARLEEIQELRENITDAADPTAFQTIVNGFLSAGNAAAFVSQQSKSLGGNVAQINKDLDAEEKKLRDLIKANSDFVETISGSVTDVSKLTISELEKLGTAEAKAELQRRKRVESAKKSGKAETELVAGTIAFVRAEVEKLRKEIENTPESGAAKAIQELASKEAELAVLERRIKSIQAIALSEGVDKIVGDIDALNTQLETAPKDDIPRILNEIGSKEIELEAILKRLREIQKELGLGFRVVPEIDATNLSDIGKAIGDGVNLDDLKNKLGSGSGSDTPIDLLIGLSKERNEQRKKEVDEILSGLKEAADKGISDLPEGSDFMSKLLGAFEGEDGQRIKEAAVAFASDISNSLSEIKRNRIAQEQEQELEALEEEYEKKISAASGNAALQSKLEAELEKKRAEINKKAAREQQRVAIIEGLINISLGITKALSSAAPPLNFILAGLTAAAGAVEIAAIRARAFASGGADNISSGQEITYPLSVWRALPERRFGGFAGRGTSYADGTGHRVAGRLPSGSTFHAGEYINPAWQVKQDPQIFSAIDTARRNRRPVSDFLQVKGFAAGGFTLPGLPAYIRTSTFQTGGFADPVIGLPSASQVRAQAISVQASATFSDDQVQQIAQIIAQENGRVLQRSLAEGLGDANRRLDREQSLNDQRTI